MIFNDMHNMFVSKLHGDADKGGDNGDNGDGDKREQIALRRTASCGKNKARLRNVANRW